RLEPVGGSPAQCAGRVRRPSGQADRVRRAGGAARFARAAARHVEPGTSGRERRSGFEKGRSRRLIAQARQSGSLPAMRGCAMEITVDDLQRFAEAWNRHDVEALMGFMTEDCVFEASAGPEVCGTRFVGRDAVRAAFEDVWKVYPDAHWQSPRHLVCGESGMLVWTDTGPRVEGRKIEVIVFVLFTLRDGRIAVKKSYRKNRPAVPWRQRSGDGFGWFARHFEYA